jgi:hypothetical protein
MRVVRATLRAPGVHFAALGSLLFAASSLLSAPERDGRREPIVITAERVAEIRDEYSRMMGAPPTRSELTALIAREADDEMLYREALLLGLDRGDPAVQGRVIEKMEFLFGEEAGADTDALRRGLELGLHRDDVVVRSGMVTKMRLLARGMSRHEEPVGEELERALAAHFEQRRDDYVQPERIGIAHVFLRGDESRESEARALRSSLLATRPAPTEAPRLGDPFVAGGLLRATTHAGLAKTFGEDFARAVGGLEVETWSDPIRSPYGLHLVWVFEKSASRVPELHEVRSRVLQSYRADRQQEYLRRMLDEIRNAYEVRVERSEVDDG